MPNTMNFTPMTRICHSIIKTCQAQNNRKTASAFHDKLIEKSMESEVASKTDKAEMSMEEYKSYIYDKIAALPMHPSNMQDSISVHISDEGFEAMKNDPEYEKWVLDSLKNNFMSNDPWSGVCGGKFSVFYFGATKEEYRGESWRLGFRNGRGESIFQEKSKDSFWERRKKRREELLAQLEELEDKKAIAKRIAKSEYYAQLAAQNPADGKAVQPLDIDLRAMQIFSALKVGVLIDPLSSKKNKI